MHKSKGQNEEQASTRIKAEDVFHFPVTFSIRTPSARISVPVPRTDFLSGMASVLDLFGKHKTYKSASMSYFTKQHKFYLYKINNDWHRVGQDLQKSMAKVAAQKQISAKALLEQQSRVPKRQSQLSLFNPDSLEDAVREATD